MKRVLSITLTAAAAGSLFFFDWRAALAASSPLLDSGKTIIHGIPPFNPELPGAAVATAFLAFHAQWLAPWLSLLLAASCAAAAWAAGGPAAAAVFAALLLFLPAMDFEQLFFASSIMCTYYYSIRAAEGRCGAAPPALFAGLSLLTRTPLLFYPPLLYLLLPAGSRGPRAMAAILGIPLALLLAMSAVNHAALGRAEFPSARRAATNVITGAMGMTNTIEGDAFELAGLRKDESAYGWAARRVLSEPLTYAASVLRRIAYSLSLHPWLAALGLAALIFLRRSRTAAAMMALPLYFLLIHCLPSVEKRYLVPFWLTLSVPIGAAAASLRPGLESGTRAAAGLAAAALAVAVLLPSIYFYARYPFKARRGDLAAELQAYPGDPWLAARSGSVLLGRGEAAAALTAFETALSLGPGGREAGEQERGRFLALALLRKAPGDAAAASPEGGAGETVYYLLTGDIAKAKRAYSAAKNGWSASYLKVREARPGPERETDSHLKEHDPTFDTIILGERTIGALPRAARLKALASLPAIGVDGRPVRANLAAVLKRNGRPEEAAEVLAPSER